MTNRVDIPGCGKTIGKKIVLWTMIYFFFAGLSTFSHCLQVMVTTSITHSLAGYLELNPREFKT